MSRVNPYFSTELSFYLAHTKTRFFLKELSTRMGCDGVHAAYFLNSIQNMFKRHLK
jgi:hypothetical protein